jgi:acyl-CoA thioester hydrolase
VSRDSNAPASSDFPVSWPVTTRWTDNDMFGHLNNAVYYELFDTAINGWLAVGAGVDPTSATTLPVVAESSCRYFSELAFPQPLSVGISVERIGTSSVTYRLGIVRTDRPDNQSIAAEGRWVHVYIDRDTRRPAPIPATVRALLQTGLSQSARRYN